MATLSAVRDGLQSTVDAAVTAEVSDTIPNTVVSPAVVVVPRSGEPVSMGRGTIIYTFDLLVLVSRALYDEAQDRLDAFLSSSGSQSIHKAIFDTPGLGITGPADTNAAYLGFEDYGEEQTVAETPFVTARCVVQVSTGGT